MPRGAGPKPGQSPAPKAAGPPARPSAPVQPHQGTNFFVSHGYLIGIVILVGALIVIVLIFKLYSREVTPEKPSRDAIQEKPIGSEEDEVDLYSQPSKLLDAKDSLELAKRASHKSESALTLAQEYLQVDTIAADSYQLPQTSRAEKDAEVTGKEEMAEAAVELETSETISKAKKRRRSSVGETLKRLWRPKKSIVDTTSRERISEGSSTADFPPAELSDTLSTKVESSENIQSRTMSGTGKSLEDTSLTARQQVKEGIDKISSQESLEDMSKARPSSAEAIAKPSVKFREDREEISIEKIDSSTELVIAEVQESIQDATTSDGLPESETERRRSSLADAINWLWKQGMVAEEEPKTLEDVTEESDTKATRMEEIDSNETMEEPVEDFGEQLQEYVKAKTFPDALPEAELERRRSSLADAIDWLWNQTKPTKDKSRPLDVITEESDTDVTRPVERESHETMKEPVEKFGKKVQESIQVETATVTSIQPETEKRSIEEVHLPETTEEPVEGLATQAEVILGALSEAEVERRSIEKLVLSESAEEPAEVHVQGSIQAETSADALVEQETKRRRSSLADAINWLWNRATATEEEPKPLEGVIEESSESTETTKEPAEDKGEEVQESVQDETMRDTLHEPEKTSSMLTTEDRIIILADHERREDETAGASEDIMKEPAEDIHERDIETKLQGTLTKSRRASEPATSSRSTDITKTKRRRSSVGQTLRKLWNPKKFQIESQLEEDFATISGQPGEISEEADIEPHDSQIDLESMKESTTTDVEVESKVFEIETRKLSTGDGKIDLGAPSGDLKQVSQTTSSGLEPEPPRVQDDIRKTSSCGILKDVSDDRPSLVHAVVRSSMKFQVELEDTGIDKVESHETVIESVETKVQESVQDETTQDTLLQQETERRRSSLADAINWLWKQDTATEVEPKTLEDVREEGAESGSAEVEEVPLIETTKELAQDEGEQKQEGVNVDTIPDALLELERCSSRSTDMITVLSDYKHWEDKTVEASENIIQEPAQGDIHEQDVEEQSQGKRTKGRRASEPATSSRSTDITKTKRRRSSVGQTLRKLWNPKKFQIDSQLEEDSAMRSVQPVERSETVDNEPHDSEIHLESAREYTEDLLLESGTSDTKAESIRMSTMGRIPDSRLSSEDARRASQRTSSILEPQQFVDDTDKIASRAISKDISKDRLLLTDADAKSSVNFLDGLKDTVEFDIQDNVQDETTRPDTLRETEAERRRSTLADAINWLWKQGTATEEQKTLENVTEEYHEMDAAVTKEVVSPETTKTLVGDDEGKVQECVSIDTTADLLPRPETEDLHKSIIEPVETERQDDVHAETTPDALPERETERRRSSLADAIDWLWNRTTLTEEEPKTLEDVKEEPDMESATTWEGESAETIQEPAEDEGEQVQDTVQAESSLNVLPQPETSSSILSAPEKITSLSDLGYRQSEATGVSENIIEEPAQGDINEQDDETQSQEKLAKGRRASEPATASRSTDITKTKRRRSSVGQTLRKLWNPKKFQIDSQLEEDSATTSAQPGENSESADIDEKSETEVEASLTMGSTVESSEGIRSRTISVTQPPCEDLSLVANEFDDEIDKTSSRGILKDISKDRPSLIDTVAKPSVKFRDDAENISIEKADSSEVTIQAVEGLGAQSETTSSEPEPETERRRSSLADAINWLWKQGMATEEEPKTLEDVTEETDVKATRVEGFESHETTEEPVEDLGGQVQENLPVETPPVTLTESETERRRSSLADEINWLWNRTTPTEEEPKTLEDVTEDHEIEAATTWEVDSQECTKKPVEDEGEQEDAEQDETEPDALTEPDTSSPGNRTADRITSLPDYERRQSEAASASEETIEEPAQENIHEDEGETMPHGKVQKERRASEPATSPRSTDITKTERRRSSVGQALRKVWSPKQFHINQLEEDSATTFAQSGGRPESADIEEVSEIDAEESLTMSSTAESTEGIRPTIISATQPLHEDVLLTVNHFDDEIHRTSSRGILEEISKYQPPLVDAVVKPSAKFQDDVENISIEKADLHEITIQAVEGLGAQAETTSDDVPQPEIERRSSLADAVNWLWNRATATKEPNTLEDVTEEDDTQSTRVEGINSHETTDEPVEELGDQVHESVPVEASPDALEEQETERRRSSLADAINWLWKQGTTTEEESKTLEDVTEEGPETVAAAVKEVESTDATQEHVEDMEPRVGEVIPAETSFESHDFPEPEKSFSSVSTTERITSLPDHDHQQRKIAGGLNIMQEPPKGDVKEEDSETHSEGKTAKGRRASEPATTLGSADITKNKRRRSSVGQTLRKLWNPKKFQISQLEEDFTTTSVQAGQSSESVENEPHDSEMHIGLVKESTTGVLVGESFTEPSQEDTTLTTRQAGDVTDMIYSRGIVKDIPEGRPTSDVVAKPSVTFLDYELENTSIGKVKSPETTVQPVGAEAEVQGGAEAETTSVAWRESETERQNVVKADSSDTTTEPLKAETKLQNSVQDETTPDGLTEPETERRRSSLADAINWLWKQGTATEEEPKTLEDVKEEDPENNAAAVGEGESAETTQEPAEDEEQVQESVQDETTPNALTGPVASPSIHGTADSVTSSRDHDAEVSENIIQELAQDDIHEQDVETLSQATLTKGRRASEPATSSQSADITKTKRRRSSVGQTLRKLWNPKKFQIDSQLEEDSAMRSVQPVERSETVDNEPHDSESTKESTVDMIESNVSETKIESRRISTDGQIAWRPSSGDTRHASERTTNSVIADVESQGSFSEKDSNTDMLHEEASENSNQIEEDSVVHSQEDTETAQNVSDDDPQPEPRGNEDNNDEG